MFIVHKKILQRTKNKRFTFLFLLVTPCLFVSTTKISYVAVEYNGCLYVFGGYNGLLDTHFSDLYKFDPGKALTLCPQRLLFLEAFSPLTLSSLTELLLHIQDLEAGKAVVDWV